LCEIGIIQNDMLHLRIEELALRKILISFIQQQIVEKKRDIRN
jgi:hypothetical protein